VWELALEEAIAKNMPPLGPGECYCDRHLSKYVIVMLDHDDEDNLPVGDWFRHYGAIVFPIDQQPKEQFVPSGERRYIQAYTVADVQRLIEQEYGDDIQPRHRVLEVFGDEVEEIQPCQQKPTREMLDFWEKNKREWEERIAKTGGKLDAE